MMQAFAAAANLMGLAKSGWRNEEGQDLVEYGILMALIAVLAIGAVSAFGNIVYTVFWSSIANNF